MSKVKDKLLGTDEDREELQDSDQVEPTVEDDSFRAEQKLKAEAQGMTAPNAVPEQRPIASLQVNDTYSPLTQKLRDAGVLGADETPMGQDAYDRASSQDQMAAAAASSRSEQIHVGNMVIATKGPHEGRTIAVTRIVEYGSERDQAMAASGTSEARFVRPKVIEGRDRGSDRDGEMLILDVDENGLEAVEWKGTGRG